MAILKELFGEAQDWEENGITYHADGVYVDYDAEFERRNKENYSYICHKGIAIFDEDETYDKFKLETICKANNDRIEDTDEEIPIILGHTIDGAQETLQPPRVGYANNFHLIQIGKNKPRWAVASDFYLDDKYDLTEYKERSVELWTEDMIIHPIALLKTSRPAKNLGVLNFKIENKDKLRKYFKEEDEELEMQKDDILNLIVETLNNSDIAAAVKKIMETQAAQSQTTAEKLIDDPLEDVVPDGESLETPIEGEPTAEGDEEAVVEGEENDEEEIAAVEEIEQEHDAGKAEETVNAIEETEKNEATPSGTNTFVPSIEEDEDEKKKIKKMSMALESQTAIASKYAEQFKQAVEERNNIANKLVVSERTNDLLKLSYEYGFNVPEELNLCLNMDAPQFEQHKVIIKSRYNKVPLDRAVINPVKEVDDNRISQEKVLEIVKYATKNNITFEQARKEIK